MRTFLLKQMEPISNNAVAKMTRLRLKSSRLTYKFFAIAITSMMSIAYAEQPLSDSELDSKYIEVKVIPVCSIEKVNEKDRKVMSNDTKGSDAGASKRSCHDANFFVAVLTNQQVELAVADTNATQSKDSNVGSLLASVFDNIRLLGGSDVLGVPAGVANTGVPVMFGNENYSYSWAGNLNQIFQAPFYESGYYNSVYDTSSLGYGFRAEAHFPYGPPPPPTIQVFTPHN